MSGIGSDRGYADCHTVRRYVIDTLKEGVSPKVVRSRRGGQIDDPALGRHRGARRVEAHMAIP